MTKVRLHKLATLEKSLVDRKLGKLSMDDSIAIRTMLTKFLDAATNGEPK